MFIEFLEKHPELVIKKFTRSNAKQASVKLWDEITATLNAIGGGKRSSLKWKATLADFKYKTKSKASEIVGHRRPTGGGGPSQKI